jgi:tetrapyrrole methylase family protein/MazG family protein
VGRQPDAPDPSAPELILAGLGPGDLDRLDAGACRLLEDPANTVILRTLDHPAARQLAELRTVESCDDLYERYDRFPDVYSGIVERVLASARVRPTIYAVPGSPLVGEFAAAELRRLGPAEGIDTETRAAESFLDAVIAEVDIDPLRDGFRVLNGHDLPSPLILDAPTVVAQVDTPEVLADVCAVLGRVMDDGAEVTVLADLGSSEARVVRTSIERVDPGLAGSRTSLFLAPEPGGLAGAVRTMHRLRAECPWDREQTHQSLVKNLVEETHELVDVLSMLPPGDEIDYAAMAEVEDELGDVLLQVLFHAAIARERGIFDIDDVAENLRRKLVRRHPHVFADVDASSPAVVKQNWDAIKAEERGGEVPESALDGVPVSMPGLARAAKLQNRAAKVGFDWPEVGPVVEKVREEIGELEAVLADPVEAEHELGDLLFAVVNLARHLQLDPEISIRKAIGRFEARFRTMESLGSLEGLSLEALDARWEHAKRLRDQGSQES